MKQEGSQYIKNWASGSQKPQKSGLAVHEMLIFHPISTNFVSKMIRISIQIEWCKNKNHIY